MHTQDSTQVPIFDFNDHFDAALLIGERRVPCRVKRFSDAEMKAFEKEWKRYAMAPRGSDALLELTRDVETADPGGFLVLTTIAAKTLIARLETPSPGHAATDDERQKFADATLAFIEKTLRECLSFEEGLIRNNGKWVTDGAGFIACFHARKDILSEALALIYRQNTLTDIVRKNFNAPRGSGTGSPQTPSQARGGVKPELTAGSAAPSDSANPAAATASSETAAGGPSATVTPAADARPSPSGEIHGAE